MNTFPSSTWQRYSKKLCLKIDHFHNSGCFNEEDSYERGMHLIIGDSGLEEEGLFIRFYWLVDKEDGMVVDVKYQLFGPPALIGAAEIVCDLLVGKNYEEAKFITADLIDEQVRDRKNTPAFPKETFFILNLVIDAIDEANDKCHEASLPTSLTPRNNPSKEEIVEEVIKDWETLSHEQKLKIIQEVIAQEIRPTLELDAGGIEVLDLTEDSEVHIMYSGACSNCYAATGSTLYYIQKILQRKVHPSLTVVPFFP